MDTDKVLITTPFPSVEETAREVGVSKKRARQIAELMDAIVQRRLPGVHGLGRRKLAAAKAGPKAASKRGAETRQRV